MFKKVMLTFLCCVWIGQAAESAAKLSKREKNLVELTKILVPDKVREVIAGLNWFIEINRNLEQAVFATNLTIRHLRGIYPVDAYSRKIGVSVDKLFAFEAGSSLPHNKLYEKILATVDDKDIERHYQTLGLSQYSMSTELQKQFNNSLANIHSFTEQQQRVLEQERYIKILASLDSIELEGLKKIKELDKDIVQNFFTVVEFLREEHKDLYLSLREIVQEGYIVRENAIKYAENIDDYLNKAMSNPPGLN